MVFTNTCSGGKIKKAVYNKYDNSFYRIKINPGCFSRICYGCLVPEPPGVVSTLLVTVLEVSWLAVVLPWLLLLLQAVRVDIANNIVQMKK